MLIDLFTAFWFLLPAALANAAPVFSTRLPLIRRWQSPIDGGRTFGGMPLLGPHKTWRGLISGIVVATAALWSQQLADAALGHGISTATGIDYASLPALLLGPALGLGALGGDAIESFFKRRRRIVSGRSWVPFDQLDYVVGAIVLSLLFVRLPLVLYGWMLVIWFVMHLLASYAGYRVGLKDRPI